MRWLARSCGALAVLATLGASVTPLLTTGCFTDGCYYEYREFGPGRMIDENTWESGVVDGDGWLPYEGRVRYGFRPPFGGRTPYDVTVHLSTSANPNQNGSLITTGSGNVVILQLLNDYFTVYNDTCATYYIHVVAHAAPFPPPVDVDAGDGGDLGEDGGDASTSDAAPDATDSNEDTDAG